MVSSVVEKQTRVSKIKNLSKCFLQNYHGSHMAHMILGMSNPIFFLQYPYGMDWINWSSWLIGTIPLVLRPSEKCVPSYTLIEMI